MQKWKEDRSDLTPFEYIELKNIPMKKTKYGTVIDLKPGMLDNLTAHAIIKNRVPLRGIEVKFIRKVLGFSLEKFAGKIGLTSGTILRWEQKPKKRLLSTNEVTVRAFFAEKLNIKLPGTFTALLGNDTTPEKIELKAS